MLKMTSISIKPLRKMKDETFFKFCQKNRDYRIERDVNGNIIFMDPAASDTGFYNLSLAAQVSL
jgi:Uma2 family endonuclease